MELEAMASSCEDYNMCMFIRNSDNGSYRSLKTTLDNNRLLKKYPYTKTLQMELKLLVNFHTPSNVPLHTVPEGVAFVQ